MSENSFLFGDFHKYINKPSDLNGRKRLTDDDAQMYDRSRMGYDCKYIEILVMFGHF